jgi:hypothetical protein
LSFEFDSWIADGTDDFAASINDGNDWDLLEPGAGSDMLYAELGVEPGDDGSLNNLSGNPGPDVRGFNGWRRKQ